MHSPKKRVLFLCTGNSCRSQMAEGILRHLAGERYESLSAGAEPAGFVHPLAIRVMQEIGIDISRHRSKSVDEFLPPVGAGLVGAGLSESGSVESGSMSPDLVVSVCASAAAHCPRFPGAVEHVQIPFDDPAHAEGNDTEKLAAFRRVRDEIEAVIKERFLKR